MTVNDIIVLVADRSRLSLVPGIEEDREVRKIFAIQGVERRDGCRRIKMGKTHSLRGAFATATVVALAVMAVCLRSSAQTEHNDEFVQRDGTRLTLGGETFRYNGPNIELPGLQDYGPNHPLGSQQPRPF